MSPDHLHETYQQLLKQNSIGLALYWPVDSRVLFPGSIGYFNHTGEWHKLDIDTSSPEYPFDRDLNLTSEDTTPYSVGIIKSSNVQSIEFDMGVSAE